MGVGVNVCEAVCAGVGPDDGLAGPDDGGPDMGDVIPCAKGDDGKPGEKGDENISAGDSPPFIAADWAKMD